MVAVVVVCAGLVSAFVILLAALDVSGRVPATPCGLACVRMDLGRVR